MSEKRRKSPSQLSLFGNGNDREKQPQDNSDIYDNDDHYEVNDIEPDDDTELDIASEPEPDDTDELHSTDPEVPPEEDIRAHSLEDTSEKAVQVTFDDPPKKKFKLDFKFEHSIILTFIAFISSAISRIFRNSLTVAIFTAYQRTAALFRDSAIYNFFFSPKSEKLGTRIKKWFRRVATEAAIPHFVSSLYTNLLLLKTRVYGFVLLSFGVTSALVHFFVSGFLPIFIKDVYAPITSAMLVLVALFILPIGKSLSTTIKESLILSTLLFVFLGIKHPAFTDNDEVHFPASGGLLIGMLLGGLTLFFPVHTVLIIILAIVYSLIVIKHPETGLISLIMLIPILNMYALVYICSMIALSYIFKILTGKRTPSFEFSDIFTMFFMIMMIMSDILTFGKSANPLVACSFILVYFLCVCALRDSAWFNRAITAVIVSACALSAYAIIFSFLRGTFTFSIDTTVNSDYGSMTGSAIDSMSVIGIVLLCCVFYLLSAAFTAKTKTKRFAYLLLTATSMLFIFKEMSFVFQTAFIIALVLFFVLRTSKTFVLIVLGIAIIPVLPLFNGGIYSGIVDLAKTELYRMDIWNTVISMCMSYGLIGIGNSSEAFSSLYSSYFVGNNSTVSHAHSLIFQLTATLGLLGLILFAIIIFFILQGSFSYGRNCPDKKSKNRIFCYAGMCSVITMVLIGFGEYIWYNPRVMLIFWLFCGLTVSARRSANDLTASAEILLELEQNYNG